MKGNGRTQSSTVFIVSLFDPYLVGVDTKPPISSELDEIMYFIVQVVLFQVYKLVKMMNLKNVRSHIALKSTDMTKM